MASEYAISPPCLKRAVESFLSGDRDADVSTWEEVKANGRRRQLWLDLTLGNFEGECARV